MVPYINLFFFPSGNAGESLEATKHRYDHVSARFLAKRSAETLVDPLIESNLLGYIQTVTFSGMSEDSIPIDLKGRRRRRS